MLEKTILIIEDDADILELERLLLSQAGYTVRCCTNGEEGLRIIREEHPTMVLLDLTLPGMDGWHIARQIKANSATAQVIILALTAHTLPGDRKRALDAGCDGYISKPLDVPSFISQISSYLQGNPPLQV